MTVRHVLWRNGQSNSVGADPCASGPDISAVPLWKDEIGITVTPVLGSLLGAASGGVGADYSIGRALLASGFHPIICNISRGSTFSNQWVPGGTYYAQMVTSITNAWAAIRAAYPNDAFVHHHVSDIGEEDSRYGYPSPSPAQQAITAAWADYYGQVHTALETLLGAKAQRWVIPTNYQLLNMIDPPAFRALQLSAAVVGTGDTRRCVTRDESEGFDYGGVGGNGLHLTGGTGGGYDLFGQKFARVFAAVVAEQGSLGATTRDSVVNHIRNRVAITAAATHYLHLYADKALTVPLTPLSATGYVPASNANNTATWPTPSGRAVSNGAAFTFPDPGATWPDVCGWKITDSNTEGVGTVFASSQHEGVPVNLTTGALSYPIGSITITAGAGGFSDAVANGVLGLIFGGTAYAQLATIHDSYFAGDPQGSGTQAGSRAAVTQASTWGLSSGGVAVTTAPISLTQQVTGTYFAEHAASSGGTPLLSAARPALVGSGGTIPAGALKTQVL